MSKENGQMSENVPMHKRMAMGEKLDGKSLKQKEQQKSSEKKQAK